MIITDTVRNPTSPPLPNHRPGGKSPSRQGTRTSSPLLPRRSSPRASTTGAVRSRSSGKSRYSRQPRSVREKTSAGLSHDHEYEVKVSSAESSLVVHNRFWSSNYVSKCRNYIKDYTLKCNWSFTNVCGRLKNSLLATI